MGDDGQLDRDKKSETTIQIGCTVEEHQEQVLHEVGNMVLEEEEDRGIMVS